MIEIFNANDCKGVASFRSSYVTFNKPLVRYFDEAYRVRVGIDKEKREVYFQLINKDYALSGELDEASLLNLSSAKTYVRVCSALMVKYIFDSFNLKIGKDDILKYEASYDEKKKEIVVKFEKGCVE